jgi:FtsZ-interacting cell division protein YlmF
MRKFIVSLVFAAAFASGLSEANAAFVIRLKNGNEFLTGRYWHEGTQVMFDTYGGVFGIDRAFVTKIEEASKARELETAVHENPKVKPQTEQAKEVKETKKPTTPAEAKAEAERKDDPITQQFDRLKERSRGVDGMLTSEIRDLLRDITAFKNKISRDSKLFIRYAREFNDAQEIGNVTENALTSRGQ